MGGYYKSHKNLNFVIVHAAGHGIPATQLAMSRSILYDMIGENSNADQPALECHATDPKDCDITEAICEHLQDPETKSDCSGHGSCANGQCTCLDDWYAADCSIQVESLKSTFNMPPRTWKHFTASADTSYEFSVTTNDTAVMVYTRNGDLPSTHFYDSMWQGVEFHAVAESLNATMFVSVYNPEEGTAHVKMSASSNTVAGLVSFWIFIVLLIVLLGLVIANLIYGIKIMNAQKILQVQGEPTTHTPDKFEDTEMLKEEDDSKQQLLNATDTE